ncbi:efflux RND transporter periplasmic adaptor subunit [Moraxella osloensis]|nr:efflux RND transporter periplasmic adaptor subunit [Moraxella osloensis]MBL7666714.1 efflux RND transporter periplasmic adaptor subunit [Moraxella osloensis]
MITSKFITKVLPLSLAVASAVISLSGCQKQQNDSKSPFSTQKTQITTASATTQIANNEIQLLAADVITAKADRFEPSVTVTGTLQPSDHTVVQSTVNAQVQQVLADVGKTVAKGEPLVRLDISDSKNQLAQAQADVAAAQAQAIVANKLAERNKILLEQGFVSQIEYERSVADSIAQREAIKAKQAQLSSAQKMFGDTTIYAPTTGIVSSRSVNVGQVVTQNQALMEIIDPNKLEFAANVPSEAQTQLQLGQQVPFTISNQTNQYIGQISRISPQVDAATRQLTIYIAVKPSQRNLGLRPGMYATGKLNYGVAQVGVLVPMSAVVLESKALESGAKGAANKSSDPSATNPTLEAGTILVVSKDNVITKQPIKVLKHLDDTSQYLIAGIEANTTVIVANLNANDVGKKVVLK